MRFSELIAVYLFLGATSAGAFASIATIDVAAVFKRAFDEGSEAAFDKRADRRGLAHTYGRVRRIVYAASLVVVAAGLLCLVADLGRPEAFYYLMLYPTTSLVSIGALALSLMVGCISLALADTIFVLGAHARRLAFAAKLAGIPIAGVVMVYTGLLLQSVVAVKFWSSPWLPALFLASASSCGCAVSMLGLCACEDARATRLWERPLIFADLAFVLAEALFAALFLTSVPSDGASGVNMAVFGAYRLPFWLGFVGCGLIAPLCMEVFSIASHKRPPSSTIAISAAMVLAGGLCLRVVVVACGVQPVG